MERKLFVTLATIVMLTGCGNKKNEEVENKQDNVKQELSIGIGAELSTADVSHAMDNTACEVMGQVAEGLYAFDKNGEVVPALAKEVTTPSKDGLTYIITLRDNATWSNGDPITAKDFEYSWKRTVDPDTNSTQAYYFDGILNYGDIAEGKKKPDELGIQAVSDTKLEITLERPMSYFSSMLAIPAFFPLNEKFVTEKGAEYGTNAESTLYNGPFTLEKWNGTNSEWVYKKNAKYWDKKNVALSKVNVQVMKETSTAVNLFNDNQLDFVQIKGEYVAQEKENDAMRVRNMPGTYYLTYNTKNELLSNKKIRQAINLSIDSKTIAENVLNDGSTKSFGFVPTGFTNEKTGKDFAEEAGDLQKFDVKKAKKLWEEGKKELGVTSGKLEILASDTDSAKKVIEFLQGSLTENLEGLTIDLSPVPFQNRLERGRSGDFDMLMGGWTPVYADPVDFLNLYVTGNANNDSGWSNKEYDSLIKESGTTYATDIEKRWETLIKADKLLAEEVPVSALYQLSEVYLVNKRVQHLDLGPLGSPYFKPVTIK